MAEEEDYNPSAEINALAAQLEGMQIAINERDKTIDALQAQIESLTEQFAQQLNKPEASERDDYPLTERGPTMITDVEDRLRRHQDDIDEIYRRLWFVDDASGGSGDGSRSGPIELGSPDEPSDDGYDGEWTVDNGTPIDLWVSIGPSYDHQGEQKLKDNKIRLRIDSAGRVWAIDQNKNFVVDDVENCDT